MESSQLEEVPRLFPHERLYRLCRGMKRLGASLNSPPRTPFAWKLSQGFRVSVVDTPTIIDRMRMENSIFNVYMWTVALMTRAGFNIAQRIQHARVEVALHAISSTSRKTFSYVYLSMSFPVGCALMEMFSVILSTNVIIYRTPEVEYRCYSLALHVPHPSVRVEQTPCTLPGRHPTFSLCGKHLCISYKIKDTQALRDGVMVFNWHLGSVVHVSDALQFSLIKSSLPISPHFSLKILSVMLPLRHTQKPKLSSSLRM